MDNFYKFNRAYYIKFREIKSETYLNNYIFPNFVELLDANINEVIAIEEDENGFECMIIFLDEVKLHHFISFCKGENIIEFHGDITYQLLTHDNLEEVIHKMLWSDEFEEQFQKFFEKNITIDTILDKIRINGEDSLTKYEINFLKDEVARNRKINLHK